MRKNKENSGITLVALVVTIVVLLILAGITVVYVFGDNGVFGQASEAKIQTELAKIEERAQMIYSDKLLESASNNLKIKVDTNEIIEQLISEDYKIEQKTIWTGKITGIRLEKESMTIALNVTKDIKVLFEGAEEEKIYYAKVQGEYYKIYSNQGFITIDRKSSEMDEDSEASTTTFSVQSSNSTIVTAQVKVGNTNAIEVTSLDKEGTITVIVKHGSLESKPCTITVKDMPIATELEMTSVRARIAVGFTRWLAAMTVPIDANQEFEWSSSDTNVATVNDKGVVLAKKAGVATITATTTDGSNKKAICTVTVVENAPNIETVTEYQTGNTIAKDKNGNLITIPGDFRVLTDLGTKVTEGIVIQDRDLNEFVWIPVDSVSIGTNKLADDIRLGRYQDFTMKNIKGNYVPFQDSDNYSEPNYMTWTVSGGKAGYAELTNEDLANFTNKAKENGGYYLARYEASKGADDKVKSQYDKVVWSSITKLNAFTNSRNMYSSNYVQSSLINSYSWDTAIIFIQKYSNNSNYANKTTVNSNRLNTGRSGDEVLHINDMASNLREWSTEYCDFVGSSTGAKSCVSRGGYYGGCDAGYRANGTTNDIDSYISFRVLLHLK